MAKNTFGPRWLTALGLLVAALWLTGCPANLPPPDNALTDPVELRHAIDARFENIEDARFRDVVLDYFGKGERFKVRQLIVVQRPDRLRVQTRLPGSDEILSMLVSNGDTFALHKRDTHEYFTGEPTRENINRLLPVDLSGADVVRIMLGGAPWDRFEREGATPSLRWDTRSGHYEYSVQTAQGGRLSMQVRHTDFAVISVTEVNAKDKRVYAYETNRWNNVGPIAVPTYRRFVWPERDLDFSINVGETQVNVDLEDQLFEFPPPPGSTIIHVGG
ncbi:MAG: hypothetical protein H0U74_15025 [Bradymonadaceae bacterium]|nr:hypothetical protein [Lujinxingiaceae bacterium]